LGYLDDSRRARAVLEDVWKTRITVGIIGVVVGPIHLEISVAMSPIVILGLLKSRGRGEATIKNDATRLRETSAELGDR